MALRRCRKCGLPRLLARDIPWPGNGTIISKRDPSSRLIIYEADYQPFLWSELDGRLGISTAETFNRSRRMALQDYLENHILYGWKKHAERFLSVAGFGEVVRSSFGEGHLEMTIHNPFYAPRLVGRIAGLFEYVEGAAAEVDYHRLGPQVLELKIRTA